MASGHVPERTCVGCGGKAPKGKLLRMARVARGPAVVDRGGGAPGRGAYLHRDPQCVEVALRTGSLARALRAALSGEELSRLRAEIEELMKS